MKLAGDLDKILNSLRVSIISSIPTFIDLRSTTGSDFSVAPIQSPPRRPECCKSIVAYLNHPAEGESDDDNTAG